MVSQGFDPHEDDEKSNWTRDLHYPYSHDLPFANHQKRTNVSHRHNSKCTFSPFICHLSINPKLTYDDFNSKMKLPSCVHLTRHLKNFVSAYKNRRWLSGDPSVGLTSVDKVRSEMHMEFEAFYDEIFSLCSQNEAFRNSSQEELENAFEGVERYVAHQLYEKLFACFLVDRYEDSRLSEKIMCLRQFITNKSLDVSDTILISQFRTSVQVLQKMNFLKAPYDKLKCISRFFRSIIRILERNANQELESDHFGADDIVEPELSISQSSISSFTDDNSDSFLQLRKNSQTSQSSINTTQSAISSTSSSYGNSGRNSVSLSRKTSAQSIQSNGVNVDDLFPVVVLAILQFAPSHLLLNINYITLLRHSNRICGETNYWFVTLQAAVSFIQTSSAKHFNMSEEEFKQKLETAKLNISESKSS